MSESRTQTAGADTRVERRRFPRVSVPGLVATVERYRVEVSDFEVACHLAMCCGLLANVFSGPEGSIQAEIAKAYADGGSLGVYAHVRSSLVSQRAKNLVESAKVFARIERAEDAHLEAAHEERESQE